MKLTCFDPALTYYIWMPSDMLGFDLQLTKNVLVQINNLIADILVVTREDLPPAVVTGETPIATLNLQEGVDIKTIQENLGHHKSAFTLDVYSDVTKKMRKNVTDKIGKLLSYCMEA